MQFASDVTDYLNKRYDLHMTYGAEGFEQEPVCTGFTTSTAPTSRLPLGQTLLQDQGIQHIE